MTPINETPFSVAWRTGRVGFPAHSLTLVVKGTFDLRPGDKVEACAPPPPVSGDRFQDDNIEGGLRYADDLAYFKPKTDLLLVGHAHAPQGRPTAAARATFRVGKYSKSLNVIGDRVWKKKLLAWGLSEPEPFVRMALTYENAYGGTGFKKNPSGKGAVDERAPDGSVLRRAPNIERPGEPILSPNDKVEPAGFAPLPLTWPPRYPKAGTYGKKWLKERWPWIAEDLDWTFFNAAPEEQQLDGYLRGDEALRFENLHREHAVYETRLPGLRVRAFLAKFVGTRLDAREVSMNLDTLWVDMDEEKLVLVWRGVTAIPSDTAPEDAFFLAVTEPLGEKAAPSDLYRQMILEKLAPPEEKEAEGPSESPSHPRLEGIEPKTEARPPHAEPEPPPPTRDSCLERLRTGTGLAGLDLSCVDLSDLDLEGVSFQGAVLKGASFRRSRLAKADFTDAVLPDSDFRGADLAGANLTNADLHGARMARTRLSAGNLAGASLHEADLRWADLEGANGEGTDFSKADLTRANLKKTILKSALLAEAKLHDADLTEADLTGATLERAWGDRLLADRADLTGLRASDARLGEARFREAKGTAVNFQRCRLYRADFTRSVMPGAEFDGALLAGAQLNQAELTRARVVNCNLRGAEMIRVNLLHGSLEKSDLSGANLAGANLFECELLDARMAEAFLQGANVQRTLLTVLQ